MSIQHFIWLYLWVAPHLLLPVVAALMLRKGSYKDFPIFFAYLLFEFLEFSLLFTMYCVRVSAPLYVKVDLFSRAGSIALHFGILHELFAAPMARGIVTSREVGRILNWITIVVIAMASVFIAALFHDSLGRYVIHTYVVIEPLNIAQCGLLALVFLWYRSLGLKMPPLAFGITVGMGLAIALEPLILALRNLVAIENYLLVGMLEMASYHLAVLVWLYYAWIRERFPADSTAALPQLVEQGDKLGRIVRL